MSMVARALWLVSVPLLAATAWAGDDELSPDDDEPPEMTSPSSPSTSPGDDEPDEPATTAPKKLTAADGVAVPSKAKLKIHNIKNTHDEQSKDEYKLKGMRCTALTELTPQGGGWYQGTLECHDGQRHSFVWVSLEGQDGQKLRVEGEQIPWVDDGVDLYHGYYFHQGAMVKVTTDNQHSNIVGKTCIVGDELHWTGLGYEGTLRCNRSDYKLKNASVVPVEQ